jgi:hypothetical protein
LFKKPARKRIAEGNGRAGYEVNFVPEGNFIFADLPVPPHPKKVLAGGNRPLLR